MCNKISYLTINAGMCPHCRWWLILTTLLDKKQPSLGPSLLLKIATTANNLGYITDNVQRGHGLTDNEICYLVYRVFSCPLQTGAPV